MERCAEEFGRFVAEGYRAVKLKTGALALADEQRRIQAVRDAIGPNVSLMLDMNAPYDVAGCIRFAEAVAPYDIFWLEEPLHWYLQPADYVRLAAASPIPLAHGEREWHRYTVRDFIDCGAIRFVQFDFDGPPDSPNHSHCALRRAEGRDYRAAFGTARARAPGLCLRRCGLCGEAMGMPGGIRSTTASTVAERRSGMDGPSDRGAGFGMDIDWTEVARFRSEV